MLIKELKVFHLRNSLNDSGSCNLLVNLCQTKSLKLPHNMPQTKC